MVQALKHPKEPLNEEEAQKNDYAKWDDEPKRYKLRKRAKFNYDYISVAARLVAAGHTEADVAYVLGVKAPTVASWKKRYPQFKTACENGKKMARNYLVSQGLRAAAGYDYTEETYELRSISDKVTGESAKELILTKKVKKHQKPDSNLLQFFLTNLDPDNFSFTKNIKVDQTTKKLNVGIAGQVESDAIRDFAGRLLAEADKVDKSKKIKSKLIKEDSSENNKETSK